MTVVSLMWPFVALGQLTILMLLHIAWRKLRPCPVSPDGKSLIDSYLRALLALLLFTFSQLTNVVLNSLQCVHVGAYSVVWLHPSLDCTSSQYHALRGFLYVILVYVLSLPVLLLVWLVFAYRRGWLSANSENENSEGNSGNGRLHQIMRFMYETYQPNRFWYHFAFVLVIHHSDEPVCCAVLCWCPGTSQSPFCVAFPW